MGCATSASRLLLHPSRSPWHATVRVLCDVYCMCHTPPDAQLMAPSDETMDPTQMPPLEEEEKPEENKIDDDASMEDESQKPEDGEEKENSDRASKKRGGRDRLNANSLREDIKKEVSGDGKEENDVDDTNWDPFVQDERVHDDQVEQPDSLIGAIKQVDMDETMDIPRGSLSEMLTELRDELDQAIQAWSSSSTSSQDAIIAHNLWSKYQQITADLSQQLCEQLR